MLAGLSWRARDTELRVAALPQEGTLRDHWDLVLPFNPDSDTRPVLILRVADAPCATGPTESWVAGPGFAEGIRFTFGLASPNCLKALSHD